MCQEPPKCQTCARDRHLLSLQETKKVVTVWLSFYRWGNSGSERLGMCLYLAESGCELFFPKAQTLLCPSALKYVPLVGVTVGCKAERYPYSR